MHSTHCLNCHEDLIEGKAFCAACSQKVNTHRISFHEILHDAIHAVTHADKGFLYLIKELALKPGKVAQEYIAGKRKKYYNPFSFLIIITGLLVIASVNFHPFDAMPDAKERTVDYSKVSPAQLKFIRATEKRSRQFVGFVNKRPNIILFISTPFLAFFFWLFYRKQKLFYAEHLTAMVFFNSFLILVTALVFAPLIYLTRKFNIYYFWTLLMIIFHVIYLAVAYKRLFAFSGIGGFLKACLYSFLASLFWVIFSIALGMVYIMYGP